MAKIIKYKFLSAEVNSGTDESRVMDQFILNMSIGCPTQTAYDANYPIAEKEAISGTIEVSGEFDYPTAPRNIVTGEYVTIEGVLYKATENIPNGEPIVIGKNAVVTSVEEQLFELTKGE